MFKKWIEYSLKTGHSNPNKTKLEVPGVVSRHFPCSCDKGRWATTAPDWNPNDGFGGAGGGWQVMEAYDEFRFTIELRDGVWFHTACGTALTE